MTALDQGPLRAEVEHRLGRIGHVGARAQDILALRTGLTVADASNLFDESFAHSELIAVGPPTQQPPPSPLP